MRTLLLLSLALVVSIAGQAAAQRPVLVSGYFRADGTYVPPHFRTAPNWTRLDNWSTRGNVNPITGARGTVDPFPARPRQTGSPTLPQVPAISNPPRSALPLPPTWVWVRNPDARWVHVQSLDDSSFVSMDSHQIHNVFGTYYDVWLRLDTRHHDEGWVSAVMRLRVNCATLEYALRDEIAYDASGNIVLRNLNQPLVFAASVPGSDVEAVTFGTCYNIASLN